MTQWVRLLQAIACGTNLPPVADFDVQSKYANALRARVFDDAYTVSLPCPYGHPEQTFFGINKLLEHTKAEHGAVLYGQTVLVARSMLREAFIAKHLQTCGYGPQNDAPQHVSDTVGLTLESEKPSLPPLSGRKRPAESGQGRRGKAVSHVEVTDSDYDRNTLSERTRKLFDPNQSAKTPSPSSVWWSRNAAELNQRHQPPPPPPCIQHLLRLPHPPPPPTVLPLLPPQPPPPPPPLPHRSAPKTQHSQRQPGLIEVQRYDPRYPSLLLQPDS